MPCGIEHYSPIKTDYVHNQEEESLAHVCDRNNCRCGGKSNCMYYNDSGFSHADYTSVESSPMVYRHQSDIPKYRGPGESKENFQGLEIYGGKPCYRHNAAKRYPSYHTNAYLPNGSDKSDKADEESKEDFQGCEVYGCPGCHRHNKSERYPAYHTNAYLPQGVVEHFGNLAALGKNKMLLTVVALAVGGLLAYRSLGGKMMQFIPKLKLPGKLNHPAVIIGLVVCALLLLNRSGLLTGKYNLRWRNSEPAEYLKEMINKFGPPSFVDSAPGGVAIWNEDKLKGTCFVRHELRDEKIAHRCPAPHLDYFYSYIKYRIPPNRVLDVLSLSGSVSYDPLKKELRSRCATLPANIATSLLATEIAMGNLTINYVQFNGLYKKYIQSTKDPKRVEEMYKQLCHNVSNQALDPSGPDYFELAFPGGKC